MAIRENCVEAAVVTFMDMAGWGFWFRGIPHKSGTEPGIIQASTCSRRQISAERKLSKMTIVPEASATSDR